MLHDDDVYKPFTNLLFFFWLDYEQVFNISLKTWLIFSHSLHFSSLLLWASFVYSLSLQGIQATCSNLYFEVSSELAAVQGSGQSLVSAGPFFKMQGFGAHALQELSLPDRLLETFFSLMYCLQTSQLELLAVLAPALPLSLSWEWYPDLVSQTWHLGRAILGLLLN